MPHDSTVTHMRERVESSAASRHLLKSVPDHHENVDDDDEANKKQRGRRKLVTSCTARVPSGCSKKKFKLLQLFHTLSYIVSHKK